MEHKLLNANGKNTVYTRVGDVCLVTNVNEKGFAPNMAYVLIPQAVFTSIQAIVKECHEKGTVRSTALNREAKDIENESYRASIVSLDKGSLIDVRFKTGELEGLSVLWHADEQGNTNFKGNDQFVWFSPSGLTYFDWGFHRVKAQIAYQKFDQTKHSYVTEYRDPSWLTVATKPGAEEMLRGAKGMKVLEDILSFAESKLNPKQDFSNIPFDMSGAGDGNKIPDELANAFGETATA